MSDGIDTERKRLGRLHDLQRCAALDDLIDKAAYIRLALEDGGNFSASQWTLEEVEAWGRKNRRIVIESLEGEVSR